MEGIPILLQSGYWVILLRLLMTLSFQMGLWKVQLKGMLIQLVMPQLYGEWMLQDSGLINLHSARDRVIMSWNLLRVGPRLTP